VVNQTLVFQIKFCGKSPALRVAAKRYTTFQNSMMKQATTIGFITLLTLNLNLQLFGQDTKRMTLKKELIGTWEFLELRDKYNNKVDTIRDAIGYEVVQGPLLTYREDGTYSKQFTTQNTDNGRWYFDNKEKAIVHFLYYEKPYSVVSQYQIDKGYVKKDKNGDYYEKITDDVFQVTADKLIILDSEKRQRSFTKKTL
jgi:hypothetical protein